MRVILVCVDFADILAVTLPYNRHHFESVTVVTSPWDQDTQEVCKVLGVHSFCTNSFYQNGAVFNKWKALEEGLDYMGREGWICLMDADVLWPEKIPPIDWEIGKLYAPLRRMYLNPTLEKPHPVERLWPAYRIHKNVAEWAGYSQIFHADDPHLGKTPWHEVDWSHAGGADSFFQRKWPVRDKIRPPFEVLHLGAAGKNWCGRATPFLDGSTHPDSGEHSKQLDQVFHERRRSHNFKSEKLRSET